MREGEGGNLLLIVVILVYSLFSLIPFDCFFFTRKAHVFSARLPPTKFSTKNVQISNFGATGQGHRGRGVGGKG